MRTLLGLSALSLAFAVTTGCGGSDAPADESDQGQLAHSDETCTATFVWLQKDAYKETGGRTTDLWPPHTTTALDVVCGKETVASAFMANHGSEPGSKDAAGNDFLAETRRFEVTGTRAELAELVDTYKGCECEPTSFLSMNSLDQSLVSDLLGRFTDLIEGDTVTCPEDTKTDLVAALKAQDFESALTIVPTCTWPGPDGNPATTLTDALQTAIAATGSTHVLDDYHVCNNDAKLQADLVTGFESGRTIVACPRTTDTCKGPMWFYDPNAKASAASDP